MPMNDTETNPFPSVKILVDETVDAFIFKTVQPLCSQVMERQISKAELIDALTAFRKRGNAPIKHGKWECVGDGIVGCSECGETYESRRVMPRNYCPCCGVRMEGLYVR